MSSFLMQNLPFASSAAAPWLARLRAGAAALLCVVAAGCGGGADAPPPPEPTVPGAIAPVITQQPSTQSVTAGQPATFTVAATGTAPLAYQWQRNGSAISGATSTSYTLPAAVVGDSGAVFRAVVSNVAAGGGTVHRSVEFPLVCLQRNSQGPLHFEPEATTRSGVAK